MTRDGGRAPSQRQLRVGEEIRHALAHVLERGEIRDPDVAGRSITVTEVRLSPDLRNATVFFTPLGGGEVATVLAGLKRVRPFLRHAVAQLVQLRYVPDLRFQVDTSFETAGRIEAVLRSAEVRHDLEGDPADDVRYDGGDQEGRDDGA